VTHRSDIARAVYRAFAAGDREAIEKLLAPELAFSSPPDPLLDRAGYFERCWPFSGDGATQEFVREIEEGDELVVTYESTRPDGTRIRNTEVFGFSGDQVARIEVYFGWNLT
jgi:hypothetical protein